MPTPSNDNRLFIMNALLVAGLIGMGFLFQKSSSIIEPAASIAQNVANGTSTTTNNVSPDANNISPATATTSVITNTTTTLSPQKPAAPISPPIIRRQSEGDD